VKKAIDERQDQQKHKFFLHLSALIISRIDAYVPFHDEAVSASLQMALNLYFIKNDPDALGDICLIVSSPALSTENLQDLIDGTIARSSAEKILPAESAVWGQTFVEPLAARLKFKPGIAETLERLGRTEKQVRMLLAVYKKTLFKEDDAPLTPDELAVLIAMAKNPGLTEKMVKQIAKKLSLAAKTAFGQKEQSDDMHKLMEDVLAGRAGGDLEKMLGGSRAYRFEAEVVKDHWEIFVEAVQGFVNLILNPAVVRKHEVAAALFDFHARFKNEQSIRGIFIIESAFVQLLVSDQIYQLTERERIIGLLEDRFVGERSMDLGPEYMAQLWRMLNKDVSSWSNLGERLNGFLERLVRKVALLGPYQKKPILEFLARIFDAFGAGGSIKAGLINQQVERIVQSILPA